MFGRLSRFLVAAILLLSAGCAAEPVVTVGVFRSTKPESVRISCKSGFSVVTGSGSSFNIPHTARISRSHSRIEVTVENATPRTVARMICRGNAGSPIKLSAGGGSAAFRGKLIVRIRDERLLILNEVALEDYVRGVVANEMNSAWPEEALIAQAIVARTVAVARLRRHNWEGFDLCDTTHCQVYRGAASETQATDAAVDATHGKVLTFSGRPIEAFYCSTCGGTTTRAFGSRPVTDAPYLRNLKDMIRDAAACEDSPHYQWSARINVDVLAQALRSDARTTPGSRLTDIRAVSRDESGRVAAVEIRGERSVEIDGYVFWNTICRALGWGRVKSTNFEVSRVGDRFKFTGKGLGHGIGMCQWGAKARAVAGWDHRQIVHFYYPGCRISLADPKKTL